MTTNNLVTEIVSKTLTDLFGQQTTDMVFSFCERNGLPVALIPQRLVPFGKLLEALLGEVTAASVSNLIAKNILAEFNMTIVGEQPTLEEASRVVWNQRKLKV
ncbi:MAG TPA: hypothetical protein VMS77_06480 [Conexivisphaerales archaeon]|nr:hypothetical protein [Conexivisphaerales archaeon]